uniref:SPK domain-containing protein n=1 Tax=Caenorhabditis tropicalis TaxID=1561998 RepID=A0A1I7SZZ5_9PELO
MSILVYDREHNFKKWYVYWIPKTKTLGVKDDKDVVYEKTCTLQERTELLKVSKTLVEEKWSSLFSESGLHIEEVCEKELVLTFALQRNITLERTELSGKFDECLYLEYLRLKTLTNVSPMKRKRTASSVEHLKSEDVKPLLVPKIDPVKKRTTRMTAKATGPEFDDE